MALGPEFRFQVFLDDEVLVCRSPAGTEQRLRIRDLSAVYFLSGDGPFDPDWWLLEGTPESISFPLGATGESVVLDRLKQLPGFQVRGMNAIQPRQSLCWRR